MAFCLACELGLGKLGRLRSGLDQGQGSGTEIVQATGFPGQCPTLPAWLGSSQARSHVDIGSKGQENRWMKPGLHCLHSLPPCLALSLQHSPPLDGI